MEIEYTRAFSTVKVGDLVEDYVAGGLYDDRDGCTEQAEANATSAQEALGRLVNILCERGALTVEDISIIAGSNDTAIKVKI